MEDPRAVVPRKQCRATTRKGNACQKMPMRYAEYCWMHSAGRIRGIPWYKNATFQVVAGFLLGVIGLIVGLLDLFSGPGADQVGQIQTNLGKAEETVASVKTDTEEIKAILLKMQEYDRLKGEQLSQRFPLGYSLLTLREMRLVVPYESRLNSDFKLDWSVTHARLVNTNTLELSLPGMDITFVGAGVEKTIHRWVFNVDKRVGKRTFIKFGENYLSTVWEVLKDTPNETMLVLGFLDPAKPSLVPRPNDVAIIIE